MTDIVTVATITAGSTIVGLFIKRWFKVLDTKIDKYHKEVNGKMTQLLAAKKSEGHEAGMAQQKADSATTAAETVQAIKDDKDIEITKT